MAKIQFKNYNQGEIVLFPQNLGERIPENHPVRLLSHIVDSLDISELLKTYKGGGTTSYHPRMLLKVVFYAYMNNIYSCRKIEHVLQWDILYMWLSARQYPSFSTINRFRSERMKDCINNLFIQVVKVLVELGQVSLDVQYIDGTKIESVANKYTFVWKKTTEKNKVKLEEDIKYVLDQIDEGIAQDNAPLDDDSQTEAIDSGRLQQLIDDLNEKNKKAAEGGENKTKCKQTQKAIKTLQKQKEKLKEYEEKLGILGDRNSYAKTDKDATFMRMKEDHMRNGQLKPGYNPQISTNRQFILNYTIHQCAGDTSTYPLHMDNFHSLYGRYPDVSVCDAGYGSEENYLYAFRHGIETFIKYNNFHKEQTRNFRNDPFLSANFYYNEETDGMYCPMGQRMERLPDARRVTDNGFVQTISRYRARNCKGCPLRCRCHRSRSERIVQVNHRLRKIKEREREKLLSDEGLRYRSQRPQDVEAVFGNLKNNKHFKRFHLRGLKKVEIEFGLLAIAHNLAKVAS